MEFQSSTSGATNHQWNFNNEGTNNNTAYPRFIFSTLGEKTITYSCTLPNGTKCSSTLVLVIKDRPKVKLRLLSDSIQCYEKNMFCFLDSSIAGDSTNCIKTIKYLFSDEELITRYGSKYNPVKLPATFCKTYPDPQGGEYTLTVEIEDCNGCITKVNFPVTMHVEFSPSIFARATYLNTFCEDSLRVSFKNLSQLQRKDVKRFKWIFGDGSEDSTNWDSAIHLYTIGTKYTKSFLPKLVVYSNIGCAEVFEMNEVVLYNIMPRIQADKDSVCLGESISWKILPDSLRNIMMPGAINWYTFPGIQKGYEITQSIAEMGPRTILCNIQHPCGPYNIYDTVLVIGPQARIEAPFIDANERFQCVIQDSVHVVDRSAFYHNDRNMINDDSLYSRTAGALGHVLKKVGNNYNSIYAAHQKRGNENVLRLWDFGDMFCEPCTTDTKKNQNVWLNCRYSHDSTEVHWYTPWDSIYTYQYGNTGFNKVIFDHGTKSCRTQKIWPSDSIAIIRDTILYYGSNPLGMKSKDSVLFTSIADKREIPRGIIGKGILDVPYPMRIYIPTNSRVFVDKKNNGSLVILNGAQFYNAKTNERLMINDENDSCLFQFALQVFADSIPLNLVKPWQKIFGKVKNKKISIGDKVDPDLHRQLFYDFIPACFNIKLNEKDTAHPFKCEQQAVASIALLPASARKLAIVGQYCLNDTTKGIDLSLENSKPGCLRSFAKINPDYINTPDNWLLINDLDGGDSILSTVLNDPFEYNGYSNGPNSNFFFLKYYNDHLTPDNIQFINIGLITGNGTGDNFCLDTVYYPKFASFPRLSSNLTYVGKDESVKIYKTCKNDTVFVTIPDESPNTNLMATSSSWYLVEKASGDTIQMVIEQFHKVESVSRYPGQKVNYTTIERYETINSKLKLVKTDTVFTAIVNTYTAVALPGRSYNNLKNKMYQMGLDISDFNDTTILDVIWNNIGTIGDFSSGSRGCIDTNGFDSQIFIHYIPKTFTLLNYKDTNLLPIDSVYSNGKMVKAYGFRPPTKGVFSIYRNVETYIPNLCGMISERSLVVGFFGKVVYNDSVICRGGVLEARPNFRYYSLNPLTVGALDPIDYWWQYRNLAGKRGFEGVTKWDLSLADDNALNDSTRFGYFPYAQKGFDTVFALGHPVNGIYYKTPGFYVIRTAAADSNGCVDTFSQNAYVTGPRAGFFTDLKTPKCKTIVEFFDTSSIIDPCVIKGFDPCDFIYQWTIRWGDSSAPRTYFKELPKQIGHDYLENGEYTIWLTIQTVSGCKDSISHKIFIPGPKPKFKPISDIVICIGDTVHFQNMTKYFTTSSAWLWNYGDSIFEPQDDTGNLAHRYLKTGKFDVYLNQFDSIANTGKYCAGIYPDTMINQDKITITVLPYDSVKLFPDPLIVCVGETIKFRADLFSQKQYKQYYWTYDGNKDSNSVLNYSRVILSSGKHTLFWQADTNGVGYKSCPVIGNIDVFADSVVADFSIDTTEAPKYCFNNLSQYAVSYRWGFFHDTDIVPMKLGLFVNAEQNEPERKICENFIQNPGEQWVCLEATNALGCKDTICKKIVNKYEMGILPPNVFTPAGSDGFAGTDKDNLPGNNVFNIYIKGEDFYHLRIYDRWGILIFESKDKNYDWNGRVQNTGNECPPATYYYILDYRYKTREKNEQILNGCVLLIR
ncbi:MAG: gliding motility-associated C-terminal domain-containing protein [Bacteroidota bacterium]